MWTQATVVPLAQVLHLKATALLSNSKIMPRSCASGNSWETLYLGSPLCVTDHSAFRYLCSIQDTSNMLTRWAIVLQSYDFTIEHKPGKLNIIPDTLSGLINFEYSEMRVAPHLAPVCRNVPDNSALHGPPRLRSYQVCVFFPFILDIKFVGRTPAEVTQEEGHTGFLIHLLSAVRAFIFLARRIQPFLSLIDYEVEFCVLTI